MANVNEPSARQMAAAPIKPTEPTVKNRFEKLFTSVIFKASETDTIYTTERTGLKSKRLASVMIELSGTGGYLKGSVYARQRRGQDKASAEFTFFGANNQTCFTVDDASAKAELDQWRAKVAADYVAWASQTGSIASAHINVGAALDIAL
jgi:hypothetical protein